MRAHTHTHRMSTEPHNEHAPHVLGRKLKARKVERLQSLRLRRRPVVSGALPAATEFCDAAGVSEVTGNKSAAQVDTSTSVCKERERSFPSTGDGCGAPRAYLNSTTSKLTKQAHFSSPYMDTRIPIACSEEYHWAPLHTSFAHELVAEHNTLVEWYKEHFIKCQQQSTERQPPFSPEENYTEVLPVWLAVARSRHRELSRFVQYHRTYFNGIDMEELQLTEECLRRLEQCLVSAGCQELASCSDCSATLSADCYGEAAGHSPEKHPGCTALGIPRQCTNVSVEVVDDVGKGSQLSLHSFPVADSHAVQLCLGETNWRTAARVSGKDCRVVCNRPPPPVPGDLGCEGMTDDVITERDVYLQPFLTYFSFSPQRRQSRRVKLFLAVVALSLIFFCVAVALVSQKFR
ncbi:hypothetical protein, conserved [Trypanosoma brucei gambiense DAL972]|uniref:Uncharacterized protein n=1 Tax=Trypanosoma brucei gambiense (strain MHOM/CI/86/DAL972) TaxID=679716 RepID=D0A096_TRYB9|nr:hypothetical protein, conserved [Trypanosoma brucei gambiense DAL972]CBH16654.1 hypothetical protein, conserved [Trypanosoma brucei gambiense DAL972]|eukprot:XP_011778918.1 hypothetical protein, conserved [Trypanosoma brucei gambiense DAL972]